MDTLKVRMKDFGIDPDSWENTAANRTSWRSSVNRGAKKYEQARIDEAKMKRALRKSRSSSNDTQTPAGSFKCKSCSRTFTHHLGLFSHSRTDIDTHQHKHEHNPNTDTDTKRHQHEHKHHQ